MRRSFIWTLLSFFIGTMDAAIVLKGDKNAAENETFSFIINQHDQTRVADKFGLHSYVAAAPSAVGTSGEFAIARVARDSNTFIAMAPEKISFNPQKVTKEIDELDENGNKKKITVHDSNEITNPFYNNGISFLSWLDGSSINFVGSQERLVLVAQNDLRSIYLLNTFNDTSPENSVLLSVYNLSLIQPALQNIPSAAATVTSGIIGITAAAPNIFAAVKPTAGGSVFGDVGSGIALAQLGSFGENSGPTIVDAETFSVQNTGGNRAAALDVTSDFVKISSDLASMGQIVDMHWFGPLNRLYIALQITGGAGGTDGGRAIVVGRLLTKVVSETNDNGEQIGTVINSQFKLEQFVPTTVFDGAMDKVVGATGANVEVSVHKVRGMLASSATPYLIGVGGVGSATATKRSVFALPLVIGNSDDSKNGTVAKKDAELTEFFGKTSGTNIPIFLSRGTKEQATVAADMPLATDAAVQVGGGDIENGDIADLYVYQDTVWITVQDGSGNQLPGIFYSHALFDSTGKIKSWTSWKRGAGTIDKTLGMEFDPSTANKLFLSADSSGVVRTVQRTEWSTGDGLAPVVQAVNNQLVPDQGGVQGLFDFVVTSTALGTQTPGLANISLLVATGLKQVLLFETSRVESGVVIPNRTTDFGSLVQFDEGTISTTFPTASTDRMILIEGGVLDDIGVINAAEIARDGSAGSNGWLFVGGVGGVAVLSQPNGNGWDAASTLDTGFDGLVSGMAFKLFGDYTFVRKIINDGDYLYILTNSQLDRIDLTVGTPGLGIFTATTLVQVQDIVGTRGSFLDAVISEKLALLATNNGLYRIADGQNVQTSMQPGWQQIDAPETIGPVRQLVAQSTTGRAQDVSKNNVGGTLYALSAFRGKDQAQIVRFDIRETEISDVSSNTVVKVSDLFVEDIPSYFASFGAFRSILATDGALFIGSRSKHLEDDPLVTALISIRSVGIFTAFSSRPLFNRTIKVGLSDSMIISALLKNSSSGSWLVGSNGGMRINE